MLRSLAVIAAFAAPALAIGPTFHTVSSFVPYFSYTGPLKVSGFVPIIATAETQIAAPILIGLDPLCNSGAAAG